MDDIPLSVLFGILALLIILSAFFSGSETGLMTLNRYRLRHLVRARHRGAVRAQKLLERPDRLIGLILLGNNFVNILASTLTAVIAFRIAGEAGLMAGAALLTLVILIFSEVTPKTLAALHPERVAFPAAFIYGPLLTVLYPFVWVVNIFANSILRMMGIRPEQDATHTLSQEELRTVVLEAGAMIPKRHQDMLLNIIDLEKVTVEDIMVPRKEITGIDLEEEWSTIMRQIISSQYTRLPVYRGSIDHVVGFIHLRKILPLLKLDELDKEALEKSIREPLFIPENTPLNRQLLNFQRERRRVGLVVDEYGDIQGLVTLEDILEEVVGEFTTDPSTRSKDIMPQEDGSYLVTGTATIRELNRALNIELPTDGPKTLNGLVLEYLEAIPEPGTSLLLSGYPIDIVQTQGNLVKTLRIHPTKRQPVTEQA
ncbi:Mg2+/Co2+ transporter CorB [Thiogranum longum]|uniref:Magnesium and cobalt efflux protein CorC n=1 Tax=Thiogranum longum TaxID=1537524 RepID=A0A4R1HF25_9GAMM|nr:HlyC/CorC family transporter [Thiogranum longum]TCK18935.1 Mg2+/Co2+ transporter CorB [Thiogranum longum]